VTTKTKPLSGASKLLTTGEVARYCDVSTNAVKKWIRNGRLKAFRTPGGHFRVESEDFKAFLATHQMPIREDFFASALKRILVVDDDAQVRAMLVEILHTMEPAVEVEEAEDGYEALLKVGQFSPDLLVMDLKMPRMDGFEACRRIRANPGTADTNILIVSGVMDDAAQQELMRCGASDWMRKPLDVNEFRRRVARLLGGTPRAA
jgi:excisionase family DNA binding protein